MFTTVFALATTPATAAVKVFLLAGQSNMQGVGTATEAPAPYKTPQTDVKYWQTDGYGKEEGWTDLRPKIVPDFFGPELSFGYTLKHSVFPNDSIYLVKYGIGGTTLVADWRPDGTGYCYNGFKAAVSAAMRNLTNAGLAPSIAGMIWMQGEGEAHTGVGAAQYAVYLTNLINTVRRDFATPNMPFVVGRISTYYGTKANNQLVRTAEETVPGQMHHVAWINTDDLGLWPLGTDFPGHYNAQGQIQLGIRFAEALAKASQPSTVRPGGADSPSPAKPALATRDDEAMRRWRANRFGLFIHWGLYAVPGGVWQGKEAPSAAEWIQKAACIPAAEYATLVHQFNPTKYDPKAWARMAREMGVRYITITTKHHEGFCLWDSKFTDFDIAATPYGRDLLGPLVKAMTAEGVDVHFYYSIIDWHHPDYRAAILSSDDRRAFDRYFEFMKNQLRELLTRYPEVRALWFDGQWEASYCENPEYAERLEPFLRKVKPGIIINNRIGAGLSGNIDYDAAGRPFADYTAGFERVLPIEGSVMLYDWEAGMTLPENQWGYRKVWTGHVKTAPELAPMLVQCASQGGNFMINFGPKPDGTFREEEQAVARDMGRWMKRNGEAIYGTRSSTFGKPRWGFITEKATADGGRIVYLCIFRRPDSNSLKLAVPRSHVRACYRLDDPREHCEVQEDGPHRVAIPVPAKLDPLATVIALEAMP
jgi:alpha-L-fucosidase